MIVNFTKALAEAVAKIRRNAERFDALFPPDVAFQLDYSPHLGENTGWTTGFWPGLLWLAYQATGWEALRRRARELGPSFDRRLATGVGVDHDLGMLFLPSRVLEYRLTGERMAREAALAAAAALAARFRPAGGYIQAWGAVDDPIEAGRTIIDSMMNIPLLFWAAGEAAEETWRERAVRHALTVGRYLVRGDGSSYHTFFFDPLTGRPLGGRTHQGYVDGSTWARGQAWGIYGFTLAYRATGRACFLDWACRLAAYFLAHLPPEDICPWDLDLVDDPTQPRDTSAAALAVCGLLELAHHVPSAARDYRAEAEMLLAHLVTAYRAPEEKEALLAEGVADLPRGRGIREGTLYGDYFYLEALLRITEKRIVLPWVF